MGGTNVGDVRAPLRSGEPTLRRRSALSGTAKNAISAPPLPLGNMLTTSGQCAPTTIAT